MKKIFFLMILLTINSHCQVKSGSVEYSLSFADDKELDKSQLGDYLKEAKKNAKQLTYSLDFKNNSMTFYKNHTLKSDGDGDTSFAEAFSGVYGKYFRVKNSRVILNEINDLNFGKLCIEKEFKLNWTLINESKMIDNYLCYKATSFIIIKNKSGEFKRDIIAWYCPKIPIPFGPKGYGDLPGLILELQEKNVIFGAKKIILNKSNIEIEMPSNKKTVSEKEYLNMLSKLAPNE